MNWKSAIRSGCGHRLLAALTIAICWTVWIPSLPAQSEGTGAIAGTVSNAATGAFLEGARVQIEGTNRTALTDRDGTFQFSPVPSGSYVIRVSYTGLDPAAIDVSVSPGEVSRKQIGLTAEVYKLSPIVVAGEREGSALAITLQRGADNVKEVLSSDAFGSLANENIGNFLQRVSGVSVDWVEGEPKRLFIRGLDNNLNSVMIDGVDMPTGTVKSSSNRGAEIDTVPADFISMIEVTKTPTPDMPAHSIGGSVNLISKSPFEAREGGSYKAGFSYDITNGGKERPFYTLQYNRLFGESKKIGLLLTSSYSDFASITSVVEMDHLASAADPAWATLRRFREDISEKKRFSLGSKLSYRFSDSTWITGSFLYSKYKDQYHAWANQFSAGTVAAGFTDRVTNVTNSTFTSAITGRKTDVDNYKIGLTGRHATRSGRLDFDVTYMPSEGTEKRFSPTRAVSGVGLRTDRTPVLYYAQITQTAGPDITNLDNSTISGGNLTVQDSKAKDEVVSARADYRHTFDLAVPAWLQAGARFLSREKSQDPSFGFYSYVGPTPMSQFLDPDRKVLIDGSFPYIPFIYNNSL